MTNYEATMKIKRKLDFETKEEISKQIGISRPTLDARLQWHNWKISEIALIEKL
jgi:hypothetical protein